MQFRGRKAGRAKTTSESDIVVVAGSGGVSGNGASPPICGDDPRPLIPPGNYEACRVGYDLCHVRRYKRTSLRFDFQLTCEPDIRVAKFVNMGPGQGPEAVPSTEFYLLWSLFNGDLPKRRQPMSLEVFAGKFCMVKVETVGNGCEGNELPEMLRYSVVREVLEVWEPVSEFHVAFVPENLCTCISVRKNQRTHVPRAA